MSFALLAAGSGGATDGFVAPSSAVTVAAGSTKAVPETVHLDAAPQRADIVLAFDTTGSMGPILAQAQTDANAIVSSINASVPQDRFAVIDFRDYPSSVYDPSTTDYPYRLDSAFTNNTISSIPTTTGDGGDAQEAYNRALWETWNDSNLNAATTAPHLVWNTGAARFVIVLGDQVGHDANFSAFNPLCPNTATDPGPSGTGLPTQTVLDLLKANSISVSFVSYAPAGSAIQTCQQAMATYAGGSLVQGNTAATAGTLASQITTLVQGAAARISKLTATATNATSADPANPAAWVSFSGLPSSTGVSLSGGTDFPFQASVQVPPDTPEGVYNVNLNVVANGVVRASTPLAITVKKPLGAVSLAATPGSVGAGIDQVPVTAIPNAWLSYYAGSTQSSPVGSTPVGSTPVGSTPVGSTPVGSTPVGSTPVGSTPVGSTPVGSTPVGSTGLFALPVGSTDLILLSQINLVGTSWDQILCGSLANQPVTALTLTDLESSTEACADGKTSVQHFKDLQLKQVDFSTSPLRNVQWATFLLGGLTPAQVGVPDVWCSTGGDCNSADASTPILQLDLAGKLASAPVGSTPVGSTPVGSTPVGSTPVGSTYIPGSKLALIPLSTIGNLAAVVNCAPNGAFDCTNKTLGDAYAANAINPNAKFADMADALAANGITINDLVVAIIGAANFPWEQLPIQGLQPYSQTQPKVAYRVAVTADCSLTSSFSFRVTLPEGFFPDDRTAKLSLDGGTTFNPAGPPSVDVGVALAALRATSDGPTLPTYRWTVSCPSSSAANAVLTFDSFVGLKLGTFTTNAAATAAAFASTATGAPVTVNENGEPATNDAANAPVINPNTLVAGHIAVSGDQDLYRVDLSGLKRGTKVQAFLDVPTGTDLDLSISKPQTASFFSAPVGSTPVGSTPIEDRGPAAPLPSETLQDVPVGSTPVGSTPVGSTPVGSTSTTRGDANEAAQIIVNGETGYATIDVTGYNGATSDRPYVLRVKEVKPPPLPTQCPARALALSASNQGTLPSSLPTTTKSLFIVNKQRLLALYPAADVTSMLNALSTLAARVEVSGSILYVDGNAAVRSAYAAWDSSPCDIGAANAVVRSINDVVASYRNSANGLPNLHYIVLVGGDAATPMARTPDPVTLSPEENEAADLGFTTSGLTKGNELYDSAAQNYLLTDGAYGAFTSIPWLGHDLLLPQLSVSRLVETPAQILGQVNQYLGVAGTLSPTSSTVSGYDFLADGADTVAANLRANFPTISASTLVQHPATSDPAWTATDVGNVFASPPSILSLNAHYNQWELQAADHSLANDSAVTTSLAGRILFTMGCHAGLNVSDTLGSGDPRYLDWAEKYATQNAAVYIANTGYGYGDSASVALSERLLALFAQRLNSDSSSIGEQWATALGQYFATAGAYDVYDEKVIEETTFYGLPFWHFSTSPTASASTVATTADASLGGTQSATIGLDSTWQRQNQFGLYRPLLPIVSKEVTSSSLPARGLWISSLATSDTGASSTPGYPTVDLSAHEPKPSLAPIFFPASPFTLERSVVFGKEHDYVNVSDQFRPITGQQRHVTAATFEVLYSNGIDLVPPLISEVHVTFSGSSASIVARITDDSGSVKRAAALINTGSWTLVPLQQSGADPTLWTATTAVTTDPEVFVEATDGQNVAYSANKGSNFTSTNSGSGGGTGILVASPVGPYQQNQAVSASYSCPSAASCSGSEDGAAVGSGQALDTSKFGAHTFVVKALDSNGNVVGSVQRTFYVQYAFKGFFAPVDNQPTLNVAKAGSAIPVKFSLSGNQGLDIFYDATYPRSQTIACDATAPVDPVDTTTTAGASSLSYDATSDQYTYTWKTDPAWAGTCRALIVKLKDGSTHRADFKFK